MLVKVFKTKLRNVIPLFLLGFFFSSFLNITIVLAFSNFQGLQGRLLFMLPCFLYFRNYCNRRFLNLSPIMDMNNRMNMSFSSLFFLIYVFSGYFNPSKYWTHLWPSHFGASMLIVMYSLFKLNCKVYDLYVLMIYIWRPLFLSNVFFISSPTSFVVWVCFPFPLYIRIFSW